MSSRRSFIRKIVYLWLIAVLLMPLYLPEPSGHQRRQGRAGQARRHAGPTAQQVSPQPGAARRDRPRQRHHQAGHAGHARRGGQHPLGEGQRLPDEEGLDQLRRHAEPDHQGPAQFHQRLDQPGLEPLLQRLGRVRRLPRAIPLGDQGLQFPQRGHQVQRATSRGCSGRWAAWSRRRSARPTRSNSTAGCSRKTTITAFAAAGIRDIGRITRTSTTGWSARTGTNKSVEMVDDLKAADDGPEPADLPLQRTDVPDVLRRGHREGRHLRRGGQEGVGRRRQPIGIATAARIIPSSFKWDGPTSPSCFT